MKAKAITTALALWMLMGLLLTLDAATRADADEPDNPISAIQKMGGSVRESTDGWEVDFHLRGRGLTDEGLAHVAALKNVTWLNLKNTQITNAGLAHLKGLEELRWLHLEETVVGDEGIAHVADLPQLEYLNLYATKVTDKSLERLAASKSLKRLYIWRTDVTDAGVAALEEALPELKIVRGVDLSKLASTFPVEAEQPKPKLTLDWVAVSNRSDAPIRSENGINCLVYFENMTEEPVKLYWISYGNGALKLYATLAPGETREQNSYSRNAWLITDENDQALGYFVVKEDDSRALIPKL